MDYTSKRAQAVRMIERYGTSAVLTQISRTADPAASWKTIETVNAHDVSVVVFPDDGETFVDHNISGDPRIILMSPQPTLTDVSVGDTVTLAHEVVTVKKIKKLDPDLTGAIIWTLLVL